MIDKVSEDDLLAILRDPDSDPSGGLAPQPRHDTNVRRIAHAGHDIQIETHYRVPIDDVEFEDPLHVWDDGSVHYHGFPQFSAPSAIDVLKLIAERLEAGDPPAELTAENSRGEH